MLKIVPNRVVEAVSRRNKAQFKGGAVAALQQTVQPIVKNAPAQKVNNGAVVKFLSSVVVTAVKAFRQKFAPALKKQSGKVLESIKTKKNNFSDNIDFSQNIGSNIKGFADDSAKQTKGLSEKIETISSKVRKTVSDFKEFCKKEFTEVKSVNETVNKGAKTETGAKKTESNMFDRLFERKKKYEKKPHSEASRNNVNKTEAPKYEKAKTEAPKQEAPKVDNSKKFFEENNVKPERKTVNKENPFVSKAEAEKPQRYSSPLKPEKESPAVENPFKNARQPEVQKTSFVPAQNVQKEAKGNSFSKALKPQASKPEAKTVVPSSPKAIKSQKPSVKNVKALKNDISTLETKIFVGNALGQDTKALKKELATKKKALAAIVKSSNKKNTKGVNGVKTKPQKKFRRLSSKNYIGKSFGAITGKGGLLSKQQYTPDGKLLRTIYNRGNGLIEVREAATNKTYFVRNGKKIEKSLIEQQNDSMKRLINIMGSANGSTEIKGLAHSYAEKCGMERVSQTVMLDGKLTKIVYRGFGYDITADGRVLAKKYTANGQVFHTDLTGEAKQMKKRA